MCLGKISLRAEQGLRRGAGTSFRRSSLGGEQRVFRGPLELVLSPGWALGGGLRSGLHQSGGLPGISSQPGAGGCTKYRRPGGLETADLYLLQCWRLGVQGQGAGRAGVWGGPLPASQPALLLPCGVSFIGTIPEGSTLVAESPPEGPASWSCHKEGGFQHRDVGGHRPSAGAQHFPSASSSPRDPPIVLRPFPPNP